MTTVSYPYEFRYPYLGGKALPVLQIQIASPDHPQQPIEIDAHLDSGAEKSLIDGSIAPAISIDLLQGRQYGFQSTSGTGISARLHRVILSHALLGDFQLEVGFSLSQIRRNLLGRDFFDLIQVGFREHQLTFYVSPRP